MTNLFAVGIKTESSKTLTENGANVYGTTGDALLDLFANIGSLRSRSEEEIIDKFAAAYEENPLLAMRMAFYARNIRGGLGERRTFKIIIKWLAINKTQSLVENLPHIPYFGRWDDLYELIDTPAESHAWSAIALQFIEDLGNCHKGEPVSLLAKWLKSENASSLETRRLGKLTANKLGLSRRQYRQALSKLRAHIDVVEVKMSDQKWNDIEFSKVPSRAMSIYRNAFDTNAPIAFEEYKQALLDGVTDIKASTLFPYDILEKAGLDYRYNCSRPYTFSINDDPILEAQWNALPNYIEEPANFLVIADTSGSMSGRPMATSVGLAVYFAERNTGDFHNMFMTFSSEPRFVYLKGKTLQEKVSCIESIVSSTDLEKALDEVLKLAVNNDIPVEDMPKALVVISDGEIDRFSQENGRWSFLSNMKMNFARRGYDLPKVVMWNVESRADRFIDTINNPDVQFISGSSPSAFKSLIRGQGFSAFELMIETLNDPMYNKITI